MQPAGDVFGGLHGVAHGNIVLLVETVGAIAGGPDARAGSGLGLVVDDDLAGLIEIQDFSHEFGVGDEADFHEDAGDR